MKGLVDAEKLARKKHQHQRRDDKVTPYSDHLEKVVKILKKIGIRDESILCAGWLHDTIEDTDTDYDDINKDFGIETANIVATVTKDTRMIKEYREIAYCKQLKEGTWQAQIVKFADILANLNDLKSSNGTNSERKEKAKNKLKYYDAIKIGLTKNKLNIPSLDSTLSDLTKVFLKYEIKI
jgi:(p)ppGpp synthase/HD superfamily hydrolase